MEDIGRKQGSGVKRDRGSEGLQVLSLNVDPISIFVFPFILLLFSIFEGKSFSFPVSWSKHLIADVDSPSLRQSIYIISKLYRIVQLFYQNTYLKINNN